MSGKLSIAREAAYDSFIQVIEYGRSPDLSLGDWVKRNNKPLRRLDRNLAKELIYGSLRWYSKIFWILQNTSNRDLKKTSPQIRAALVVGTYQIYYMDRIPDRAAVNESAEYIREKGQGNAVKFVNGILRQIARRGEYFAKPDKEKFPNEYLALQFSHPRWMVDRWSKQFRFSRLSEMLAANNVEPPLTVRINTMLTPMEKSIDLRQELLKSEKLHSDKRPLRSALTLKKMPNTDPESLFGKGFVTIQGEASQLIGLLVDPRPGETIVDACCGPGGKLSHLYELAFSSEEKLLESKIIGLEINEHQYTRTKETLNRLGCNQIELIKRDFLLYADQNNSPNKILLDAPCSGMGVLRRHPDGKWNKKPEIIQEMVQKQRKLISHALKILAPGGELVYSVCSFEQEETLGQLDWLLSKYKDNVEQISPVLRLPDYYKKYVTRENVLLIYSGNQDNMDGFGSFIIKKLK